MQDRTQNECCKCESIPEEVEIFLDKEVLEKCSDLWTMASGIKNQIVKN